MNKNLIMLSGLPRSGSTVLCSLLNQHPDIHTTTTSPIIELIDYMTPFWYNISNRMLDNNQEQYFNMIDGLCDGAYKHIDKKIIIDKNRLWPRHIKLMSGSLNKRLKFICTVRPIPEIIASYVTLINKNSNKVTFIDQDLIDSNMTINTKNRCKIILEKYIMHPYTSLKMAYNSKDIDICFVSYDDIVNDSQSTIDKICEFIGIDSITIHTNNLQKMDENDAFHGGIDGLHEVRPELKRISPPPEEIIGHDLTRLYTSMKLEFWNK